MKRILNKLARRISTDHGVPTVTTEPSEVKSVMGWSALGPGWWRKGTTEVPSAPLTDDIRRSNHYPATITTVASDGVSQHLAFDPSMKQHEVALRASEPRFTDATQGERWYEARRAATAAVLAAIADSEFADHLVLRGSVLLKQWFGESAREPGDLDFIVDSAHWGLTDARTDRLFETVARGAETVSQRSDVVRIAAAGALSDDIWTYDRVPGRRLVLPWTADGCPDGSIQLDFVFGEHLPDAPQSIEITADGGSPVVVLAASPELSLAWKVLWLLTDVYPQGKDLYDAVLLAESTPLRYELLRDVFASIDAYDVGGAVTTRLIRTNIDHVDWDAFKLDYPQWELDEEDLRQRLFAVLTPIFAGPLADLSDYQQRVRWLAPQIERCRSIRDLRGPAAMQAELVSKGIRLPEAIIVTREIKGSETTVQDAARELLAAPAWRDWASGLLVRRPEMITDAVNEILAAEHDA